MIGHKIGGSLNRSVRQNVLRGRVYKRRIRWFIHCKRDSDVQKNDFNEGVVGTFHTLLCEAELEGQKGDRPGALTILRKWYQHSLNHYASL